MNGKHYYASGGRFLEVQSLVNEGVDLEWKDRYGNTPLISAASGLHREVVELLINSGADIHSCNINGWTVLHKASAKGSVEIVQCLVDKGMDINIKNVCGETPLMLASDGPHREVGELLINSGADIHCCDNYGWTALHFFSIEGSVEIVQCLVNKGVPLNIKVLGDGKTPLMMASNESHREVVEFLINSGADIHCCDNFGFTALHFASFQKSVHIIQSLVNKVVNTDVKNFYGETPLMLAAQRSHSIEVVEFLINAGADIHCYDDKGWTVMHHASYGGFVEIVQCLVNNGVALDLKNSIGCTPLMLAAKGSILDSDAEVAEGEVSHREVVEMLIKLGVDIHCSDDNKWTVLHHAVYENDQRDQSNIRLVQLLLQLGVDINARTSEGNTPLHFSVRDDEIEITDNLLKAGADCNLEDSKGESPFSILIREKKHVETIKLCIEKGGYVKATDYNILFEVPALKNVILQDIELCSKAVINKFDNKDLPLLYEGHNISKKLPRIDKMKIRDGTRIALEIVKAVTHEIKTKGFYNLFDRVPSILRILSVKSILKNYDILSDI